MGILNRDITTEEYTSFLGAGCYKHQVPAICDEINSRGEFLTAYCGDTYSDHGKMQAIFEYTSMMGELLDTDVVSYTTYDGGQAVASSLRMAVRAVREKGMAGKVILVPKTMNPEIYSQVVQYCRNVAEVRKIAYEPETGLMDLEELKEQLAKKNVAAVFLKIQLILVTLRQEEKKLQNWHMMQELIVLYRQRWQRLELWRAR